MEPKSSSQAADGNLDQSKKQSKYFEQEIDEKLTLEDEQALDRQVEKEWKDLTNDKNEGTIAVANDPELKAIWTGLTINFMNMRDAASGEMLWKTSECGPEIFLEEQTARIPARILACESVSREINFTSTEEIRNFRLEQRVFFDSSCIEGRVGNEQHVNIINDAAPEWLFNFGFVIAGSTNSWQQTIEGVGKDQMMNPEMISGKLTIETGFYDNSSLICKTVYRVFYD